MYGRSHEEAASGCGGAGGGADCHRPISAGGSGRRLREDGAHGGPGGVPARQRDRHEARRCGDLTEFAASELLQRISRFVDELARGNVPDELALAFPGGLSAEQKTNVQRAQKALDQLTCTTIHGFAQKLIKPYPAEADIDPGAEIVDPAEADLAFQERYESWLRAQLSGQDRDGVVAELVLADERRGLKLLFDLAQFLRRNRDAQPAGARWSAAAVHEFAAANAFSGHLDRLDFQEQQTDGACAAFSELVEALSEPTLLTTSPSNRALVEALMLPRHEAIFTQNLGQRVLKTATKWQQAAAAVGRSRSDGRQAYDHANRHYVSAHAALEALFSALGAELLARLAAEMKG